MSGANTTDAVAAKTTAARVALVAGGEAHSFAALARMAARRAAELPRLAPGRPLVLEPTLGLGDVSALYAAALRGAPVALLPRAPERELAALRAALPARVPEPVAALLYTSGSTGRRRCAMLDRAAFAASAAAGAAVLGWRDDDRWLACLPLSSVGGLSILSRCLRARSTAVLVDPSPRFDAAAIARQIERDRVTLASLVPTMLVRLLDLSPAWRPPARLRAVLLGGAPASDALLARAAARGLPVHTTYSMTETCSHVAIDGRALPGIEIAVREADGDRIAVRGPVVLRGFAPPDDRVRALDPDGWFVTADRGAIAGGRLRVLGRADDVIVSGGEKIDPCAVEAVLESIPGVAAACVFAVADAEWGQRVAAALVAGPDGPPRARELEAALAEKLARHQRPRHLAWIDELATATSGKLDRRETARRAAAHLAPRPRGRP
ncbi:MAG TPA: AMP-binding protein [Kofleriaceae bacterium]|nr:AMP-binding protein [Kofleriaceae bacterium]